MCIRDSLQAHDVHDLLLRSSRMVGGAQQVDAAAAVSALGQVHSAPRR